MIRDGDVLTKMETFWLATAVYSICLDDCQLNTDPRSRNLSMILFRFINVLTHSTVTSIEFIYEFVSFSSSRLYSKHIKL